MRIADNTNIKLNVEEAKRSAKFLHNMFTTLGIKYWMDYGTLLGIVRDKAFIPYDTDVECYMFFKDETDKMKVVEYLKIHGFKIIYDFHTRQGVNSIEKEGYLHMSFGWFKYHPVLSKLIPKRLFLKLGRRYTRQSSEFIRPHEGEIREKRRFNCWVRSFLPLVFCDTIKTVPFYDFEVCIPGRAEELLQIRYGEEWGIPTSKYTGYTV